MSIPVGVYRTVMAFPTLVKAWVTMKYQQATNIVIAVYTSPMRMWAFMTSTLCSVPQDTVAREAEQRYHRNSQAFLERERRPDVHHFHIQAPACATRSVGVQVER